MLRQGAKKLTEEEEKKAKEDAKNAPKWDHNKLAINNWFSCTYYFKVIRNDD